MMRTHTCGELRMEHVGQTVSICGWVQNTRDLGHFVFVVLRDRYGLTQFNVSAADADKYDLASSLGREFVLRVTGTVAERESKNPKMPTGDIEIIPTEIEILNKSETPPFIIGDETDGLEEVRLRHRYLDLRRPVMRDRMVLRSKLINAVRSYLSQKDFLEIETPVLIKSTPEGARDFLVPSRLQHGSFYALPQSPQILKQLLMVGGMDRYYQIVKCFRDEDFRGDRQPEFTQIDCEMSFVSEDDILETFEGMVKHVFKTVGDIELPQFQRMKYADALAKYGSDKPDLRFGSPIVELNDELTGSGFKVFDGIIEGGGLVAGINGKGCASYSRKKLDKVKAFVMDEERYKGKQAKGLIWIIFNEDGSVKSTLPSSIFDEAKLRSIGEAMDAQPGDVVFISSDRKSRVRKYLGDLRLKLAKDEGWIKEGDWSVLYIVDFPLFDEDEETGERTFSHHPFVMPKAEQMHLLDTEPEKVYAYCYDMVMNGNEIMSGSIRIHRPDIQEKIFDLLGMSEEEQQEKFGFMLEAFKYGAPPHGGCAFGVDRWAMLMAGGQTIRDVIAFPKVSSGKDLMMDAPASVPTADLKALGIDVSEK